MMASTAADTNTPLSRQRSGRAPMNRSNTTAGYTPKTYSTNYQGSTTPKGRRSPSGYILAAQASHHNNTCPAAGTASLHKAHESHPATSHHSHQQDDQLPAGDQDLEEETNHLPGLGAFNFHRPISPRMESPRVDLFVQAFQGIKRRFSAGGVPLHIDPMFSRSLVESHGSSPSHTPTTSSSLQDVTLNMPTDRSSESIGKVPTPHHARSRRRASMQDALDHTKINTSLYDKMQSFSYQDSIDSVQEEHQGLGCLNLSLAYDTQYGLLTIKLIQAQELVAKDGNNTANPYCKLRLQPCRRPQLQSKMHKKTLSPELEEEFIFEVPPAELAQRTLEILMMHHEQGGPDDCLGQVLIPLNLDLSDKTMLWRQVCPFIQKKEDTDYGDIMFSLSYLPSAERLTVVLIKGRNIRPLDESKTTANPCVKVLVTPPNKKSKKKKTSTQRNTLYPGWNEALVFNISKEHLKSCTIEFIVSSDNLLGTNEVLGKVILGPDTKGEDYSHWKDLVKLRSGSARWHALQAAPP